MPKAEQQTAFQTLLCEQEMGAVTTQLADAFGLLIQCRDNVGEQTLLAQTVHTLQQAVQPGKPLYPFCVEFSTEDYQEVSKHPEFHCIALLKKERKSFKHTLL